MSTISVSLPSDGTGADVSDYNNPITTIVNAINGGLDSNNVSSLSGTKITAATIPSTALDSATLQGWNSMTSAPNTVTYNGNRSYTCVFNSVNLSTVLSAGMRLRTTRTVAAPTQCTNLNGSTQFYSKTSPAGMTFTDDFVVSAWVKYTGSYGTAAIIASRYNGTSGWDMGINTSGQVFLEGFNASASNFSTVVSYQSLPVNKWVHVTTQLDMSTFTATTTTSYIMLDGVDVPSSVSRGGTNPTAIVQAGNLEIGSRNGGLLPWTGKIAQAAVFNAKVTQATMQGYISQGLAGTETSLISAYSFNNTINDLVSGSANNLTANGSAVATNADSPFGGQADSTISSTLDYGIIQSVSFSTNTTVVVQVAEGCTIPSSGGVSTVVYSTTRSPYGFPAQSGKWEVSTLGLATETISLASLNVWYPSNHKITAPIGAWTLGYEFSLDFAGGSTSVIQGSTYLSSSAPTNGTYFYDLSSEIASVATTSEIVGSVKKDVAVSLTSATTYTQYAQVAALGATGTWQLRGSHAMTILYARNAYL